MKKIRQQPAIEKHMVKKRQSNIDNNASAVVSEKLPPFMVSSFPKNRFILQSNCDNNSNQKDGYPQKGKSFRVATNKNAQVISNGRAAVGASADLF